MSKLTPKKCQTGSVATSAPRSGTPHAFDREVRRIFRLLAEPGSYIARCNKQGFGLFTQKNRWQKSIAAIEPRMMKELEDLDLIAAVERHQNAEIWRPTPAGLAYYRRLEARSDPFRAQHQLVVNRNLQIEGKDICLDVNEGETPLGWLRRRRGANGRPLVSAAQFAAGEKLRRDFTLAHMTPRVTTDWSMAMGASASGRAAPRDRAEISDMVMAARQRVEQAMASVGPGLNDALLMVCCHLEGLEEAERKFGWPQRSGKVVLLLALDRLVAHYGMERLTD